MLVTDRTNGNGQHRLFPAIIRRARLRAGLTQDAFASRCGVQQSHVSQWENDGKEVKEETLIKVADALGMTLAQLLAADEAVAGSPAPRTTPTRGKPHGKRNGTPRPPRRA
jgi:transcriptional regulator with XRE-family HTH domain